MYRESELVRRGQELVRKLESRLFRCSCTRREGVAWSRDSSASISRFGQTPGILMTISGRAAARADKEGIREPF